MNSIRFYGAVDEVTGSKIEVTSWKDSVLMDCGSFQGHRDSSYLANKKFPEENINPNFVILSHAHIDHAGMIPALVKHGYSGNIYSTPATYDLCKHMLPDAAKVMEKDLPIISKMLARSGHKQNVDVLYDEKDVSDSLKQFVAVPYGEKVKLTEEIEFELTDNCHILGSASVKLTVDQKGRKHKIWYTSDLGHDKSILSNKPVYPQDITHLIIETTYGNKSTIPGDPVQALLDNIVMTYRRKGKIIIPAFSIHRMQTIILILHKLYRENALPNIPIYVDSPLGNKVTGLYGKYKDHLNEETMDYFTRQGLDPFVFDGLTYINDIADTMLVSKSSDPCIIISASGMCEGGMVRTYLKDNIQNSLNHVLLVGYSASGTLGRRLLEGRNEQVIIDGEKYIAKCQTTYIEGFSAHAYLDYLLDYVDKVAELNKLKKIYLIHGEPDAVRNVKNLLQERGHKNIIIPKKGYEYKL